MTSRKMLTFLVFALPVLIVSFAVLMAGYLLVDATGDTVGASLIRGVAAALILLTAIDLILLVIALGLHAVAAEEERSRD